MGVPEESAGSPAIHFSDPHLHPCTRRDSEEPVPPYHLLGLVGASTMVRGGRRPSSPQPPPGRPPPPLPQLACRLGCAGQPLLCEYRPDPWAPVWTAIRAERRLVHLLVDGRLTDVVQVPEDPVALAGACSSEDGGAVVLVVGARGSMWALTPASALEDRPATGKRSRTGEPEAGGETSGSFAASGTDQQGIKRTPLKVASSESWPVPKGVTWRAAPPALPLRAPFPGLHLRAAAAALASTGKGQVPTLWSGGPVDPNGPEDRLPTCLLEVACHGFVPRGSVAGPSGRPTEGRVESLMAALQEQIRAHGLRALAGGSGAAEKAAATGGRVGVGGSGNGARALERGLYRRLLGPVLGEATACCVLHGDGRGRVAAHALAGAGGLAESAGEAVVCEIGEPVLDMLALVLGVGVGVGAQSLERGAAEVPADALLVVGAEGRLVLFALDKGGATGLAGEDALVVREWALGPGLTSAAVSGSVLVAAAGGALRAAELLALDGTGRGSGGAEGPAAEGEEATEGARVMLLPVHLRLATLLPASREVAAVGAAAGGREVTALCRDGSVLRVPLPQAGAGGGFSGVGGGGGLDEQIRGLLSDLQEVGELSAACQREHEAADLLLSELAAALPVARDVERGRTAGSQRASTATGVGAEGGGVVSCSLSLVPYGARDGAEPVGLVPEGRLVGLEVAVANGSPRPVSARWQVVLETRDAAAARTYSTVVSCGGVAAGGERRYLFTAPAPCGALEATVYLAFCPPPLPLPFSEGSLPARAVLERAEQHLGAAPQPACRASFDLLHFVRPLPQAPLPPPGPRHLPQPPLLPPPPFAHPAGPMGVALLMRELAVSGGESDGGGAEHGAGRGAAAGEEEGGTAPLGDSAAVVSVEVARGGDLDGGAALLAALLAAAPGIAGGGWSAYGAGATGARLRAALPTGGYVAVEATLGGGIGVAGGEEGGHQHWRRYAVRVSASSPWGLVQAYSAVVGRARVLGARRGAGVGSRTEASHAAGGPPAPPPAEIREREATLRRLERVVVAMRDELQMASAWRDDARGAGGRAGAEAVAVRAEGRVRAVEHTLSGAWLELRAGGAEAPTLRL